MSCGGTHMVYGGPPMSCGCINIHMSASTNDMSAATNDMSAAINHMSAATRHRNAPTSDMNAAIDNWRTPCRVFNGVTQVQRLKARFKRGQVALR